MTLAICVLVTAAICFGLGRASSAVGRGTHRPKLEGRTLRALESIATSLTASVQEHNTNVRAVERELADLEQLGSQTAVRCARQLLAANEAFRNKLHDAENRLASQAALLQEQSKASRIDGLTQLFNRRALDERLEAAFAAAKTSGSVHATVVMLDIDFFKRCNDEHGH